MPRRCCRIWWKPPRWRPGRPACPKSENKATGRNLALALARQAYTGPMSAAEKIKRLNRLYAVASGINEAIVRMPGETQLYEEACRIAVERGGFMMAWVGRHDPAQAYLAPVARWG